MLPFTSGSAFVEVLIILFNVWNGLGGPTIRPGFEVVDYRYCPLRSHEAKRKAVGYLDQAENYIFDWTWLHCSKDVVQSHCNQYLSEAKLYVSTAATLANKYSCQLADELVLKDATPGQAAVVAALE